MSCVLSLYPAILVPIWSDWISDEDLCYLDSAVTSHGVRDGFLKQLEKCFISCSIGESVGYYSYILWMSLRGIGFGSFDLRKSSLTSMEFEILKRTKYFASVKAEYSPDLIKVLELWPHIRSLELFNLTDEAAVVDILKRVQGVECLEMFTYSIWIPIIGDDNKTWMGSLAAQYCPDLKCFKTSYRINLETVLRKCQQLKSIEGYCSKESFRAVVQCSNLQKVVLTSEIDCLDLDEGLPGLGIPEDELNQMLRGWDCAELLEFQMLYVALPESFVVGLVQKCLCLTTLIVYSNLTDASLSVVAKCCPCLTGFGCNQSSITDSGLTELVTVCNLLTELDLHGCEMLGDDGIQYALTKCERLIYLTVTNTAASDILLCRAFDLCPSLLTLQYGNEELLFNMMSSTVRNVEYLWVNDTRIEMSKTLRSEHLILDCSSQYHVHTDVHRMLQQCAGLLSLSLRRGTSLIAKNSLSRLAEWCPSLTELLLVNDTEYSPLSLDGLKALSALRKLTIACVHLTNCLLSDIVKNNKDLIKIGLTYCDGYDDAVIFTMASKCPKLQVICLSGLTITSKSLVPLLEKCEKLHHLHLFRSGVDKEVLETIARLGRTMTSVELRSCSNITREDVVQFREGVGSSLIIQLKTDYDKTLVGRF